MTRSIATHWAMEKGARKSKLFGGSMLVSLAGCQMAHIII